MTPKSGVFAEGPKSGQKRGLEKVSKKVSRMGELLNTHENVHPGTNRGFPGFLLLLLWGRFWDFPGPDGPRKPEKPGVAISRPAGTREIGSFRDPQKMGFLGGFGGGLRGVAP